ncbi:hypothetical protein MCHUDSM44219_04552 [Mycolicibacterium chubuense]|uniref:Uncharacterized protein n=1 Tax=Mycolicibacterium chubuense TaxID=1800 RepID=A0A0J6VT64_MYCCU|nr:hypothetical protein MCHUDSM44219_04552 [Mycolicibacterium chubuense]SPX98908.1 Uncharacterised protein [Mycolicibacterium chubuense]
MTATTAPTAISAARPENDCISWALRPVFCSLLVSRLPMANRAQV